MPVRLPGGALLPGLPTRPVVTAPTLPTLPTTPTVPTPVAPAPISPSRPGWGPSTSPWMKPAYDISIPDHLGRPPRVTDVTIKKGFDGLSPDEVTGKVKKNLKGTLHPSNKTFVEKTIRENHRAFTMAISNMFVADSPPNRFVGLLAARNTVTVQGTMSSVNPVIIKAQAPGQAEPRYYAKGPGGDYVEIPAHKYPVVMESQIRFRPEPSLTVNYPVWRTPALAGPITTITEL